MRILLQRELMHVKIFIQSGFFSFFAALFSLPPRPLWHALLCRNTCPAACSLVDALRAAFESGVSITKSLRACISPACAIICKLGWSIASTTRPQRCRPTKVALVRLRVLTGADDSISSRTLTTVRSLGGLKTAHSSRRPKGKGGRILGERLYDQHKGGRSKDGGATLAPQWGIRK